MGPMKRDGPPHNQQETRLKLVRDRGEEIVSRFRAPYRARIRHLSQSSNRLADLLHTFPGILFALATGFGDPEARAHAYSLVEHGVRLRLVAQALGVPWWMRRLPPEAFIEPFQFLPDGAEFSRRIVNHIPGEQSEPGVWLKWISRAAHSCDDSFALWLAGQPLLIAPTTHDDPFQLMAVWAWFSDPSRAGTEGHALIHRPWHGQMRFAKAVEEAKGWYRRIKLQIYFQDGGIEDSWLSPGEAKGYRFVPLRTPLDHFQESRIVRNCADQYADQILWNISRLFGIRRDGRRVGTLEIGHHRDHPGMPAVKQLRSMRNQHAQVEIWQAAYQWLGNQDLRRLPMATHEVGMQPDASSWQRILSPYVAAKGGWLGLPSEPSTQDLHDLDAQLAELDFKADEIELVQRP